MTVTYAEGDRCVVCGYWLWRDGSWHSLEPISVRNGVQERLVLCPICTDRTRR